MKTTWLTAIALFFGMAAYSQDTTRKAGTKKATAVHHKHKKHGMHKTTGLNNSSNTSWQSNPNSNNTGSSNGTMPNNPDPGKVTTDPNKGAAPKKSGVPK